jgi:hypothetical protein
MLQNFEANGPTLNGRNVLFFLLFYNVLDLNNQKILWLPSIFQFERTETNLNHPMQYALWTLDIEGPLHTISFFEIQT